VILGIGTDLVDIRRIERLWTRFHDRFVLRVSSPLEETGHPSPLLLAKRFAGKEACSKALGVGIGAKLSFRDITIRTGLSAPPQIEVTHTALLKIHPQTDPSKIKLDFSLSDEYPYVQAFVIVSQV
jgi:holo-[acyl-carrier protein] synthase